MKPRSNIDQRPQKPVFLSMKWWFIITSAINYVHVLCLASFSFFLPPTYSHPCAHIHEQPTRSLETESFYPFLDQRRRWARPICHSYNFSLKPLVMLGNNPRWKSLKFNLYAYVTSCFSNLFDFTLSITETNWYIWEITN